MRDVRIEEKAINSWIYRILVINDAPRSIRLYRCRVENAVHGSGFCPGRQSQVVPVRSGRGCEPAAAAGVSTLIAPRQVSPRNRTPARITARCRTETQCVTRRRGLFAHPVFQRPPTSVHIDVPRRAGGSVTRPHRRGVGWYDLFATLDNGGTSRLLLRSRVAPVTTLLHVPVVWGPTSAAESFPRAQAPNDRHRSP